MKRKPSGVCHASRTGIEWPTIADDDVFEVGRVNRAPEERQRVHLAGLGVDDLGIVVLPPGLVLLGSAVMIDGEEHRARGARRRAEIDGRLPAVRADLEQRTDPAAVDPGRVQRQPFVIGHEALGPARDFEQFGIHARRRLGERDVARPQPTPVAPPSSWSECVRTRRR